MRAVSPALLAAGLLLVAPNLQAATKHKVGKAAAASLGTPACVFDADRAAFDIEGLKSQLMVTAVTCGDEAKSKYNAFMQRYQPQVASAEQVLQGYFKKSYGKAGPKQYDEYMTQLADNQEQVGLKAGTAYCSNLNAMYDEVLSLHDGSELHDYSNAKLLYQPATFDTCSFAPPAATKSKVRHSKAKHA
jgi:hypothetical protein